MLKLVLLALVAAQSSKEQTLTFVDADNVDTTASIVWKTTVVNDVPTLECTITAKVAQD